MLVTRVMTSPGTATSGTRRSSSELDFIATSGSEVAVVVVARVMASPETTSIGTGISS